MDLGRRQRRAVGDQPALDAPWRRIRSVFSPAPSSAISMTMLPAWWKALRRSVAVRRLAGRRRARRRLDAVIDAVAHHVHQRIVDVLDDACDRARCLRPRAPGRWSCPNLLAQVAHQARHLLERLADRHHAHRHRVALQIAGDPLQLRQAAAEALVGRSRQRRIFGEDRLRDDQLADHVDEVVELPRVDLDRALVFRPVHASPTPASSPDEGPCARSRDNIGALHRATAAASTRRSARRRASISSRRGPTRRWSACPRRVPAARRS